MSHAKRILLVDANVVPRGSLAEQLGREGAYAVVEAGSGAEARSALAGGEFAVAIIDQALPDGGGEALAQGLRKGGFAAPILLLAEEESGSGGVGTERIAKPFRFVHLLARLNALAGRHVANDEAPLQIGPYLFRPGAKLLTDAARKIRLTEKETNILKFLHAAAATVPRETLLHEVWGYNPAVTTHTLETHIYRLRRKIEEIPGKAAILVTEGGGYRLA
jgi:DNA-binding response OmpR family regulator